ncbi:hypothetical protein B0I35DRAFT_405413 [Stachybotrys elegans]|uniref:Spray n=1 Tax=Stachybotrys elegans TaxID=80388 RepID=A0A8K0SZH6_9HYPO|nr:hypothetical protein B0I35DRAFT_405413 [Stachybotrys elegans]
MGHYSDPRRQQPAPTHADASHPYYPTRSNATDSTFQPGNEALVSPVEERSTSSHHQQAQYTGHTYSPGSLWSGYSAAPTEPPRLPSYSGYASQTPSSYMRPEQSYGDAEEIDLSLLSHSAPMGMHWGAPKYESIPIGDDEAPAYDITTTMGPMSFEDQAFIKEMQDQEAKGNLTGGLGQGFRPDSTVRDSDLLASPSIAKRLSRSFSRRKSSHKIGRAETIRSKGQDEANRRGEVIEVILEEEPVEPAEADLSVVGGTAAPSPSGIRRSTLRSRQGTQVFYPRPNWKPVAMRWPYLSVLIVLSLALAFGQEMLYQHFATRPILKFTSPDDVDPALYFVLRFVPMLSAVVYGVLWQFVDFEVRRLEPYHSLSRRGGALAAESLNVDYVTSIAFLRPFRALKLGHYAVALSSLGTLLAVSLVPTFASASIYLTPDRQTRLDDPMGEKSLRIAETWSRLLTTTLAICSALGLTLFFMLQTRRSGLAADVRGIAGLASMAVVSHILMDFRDMDTAKHKDIHQKLKYNRYMLRNSSLAPDDENTMSTQHSNRFKDDHLPENPHPLMLRPAGGIPFIIALVLFTALVPAFLFTPASALTEAAPWVVTALAVALKLSWNSMETAVRMMEPYAILARRHAPAKTLSLDYTALPFGYLPIRAFINGHMLVFFVGFGSIMTEFLTILVSGLATVDGHQFIDITSGSEDAERASGTETFVSFYVSLILSLFILLYMGIVATVVFFRRRHPFLPRQPNTIASVLAYIHQSKMLYDFVGTEKMGPEEMLAHLGDDKTYGLGWFVGRDGQLHCGVDEEELKGDYKHGVEFLEENQA